MRIAIPTSLKRQVALRAHGRCEYCLLPEVVSLFSFHVDHIKSVKHGGLSILLNLAYCCPDCNFFKGSDLGTFLLDEEHLIRFFNPRKDDWHEHFEIIEGGIYGRTPIGESTVRIFKFNDVERLIFRQQLIVLGHYHTK
jgi:HNH endonuclease